MSTLRKFGPQKKRTSYCQSCNNITLTQKHIWCDSCEAQVDYCQQCNNCKACGERYNPLEL